MNGFVLLENATDPALYGGKASALAHMRRAGLPVPGGWAIPTDVAARTADGSMADIERLMILGHSLKAPVAVRSSALGEDSKTASYAGQHATILGVQGGRDLLTAIVKVALSSRLSAARNYRSATGELGSAPMAVVIQELVQPDAAGVLFSENPLDGADERFVEANWGLGEAVVSGRVSPDRIVFRRGLCEVRYTVGCKRLEIVPSARGTLEREVLPSRQQIPCLTDADLHALDDLASKCEGTFAGPQDIEWAKAGGQMWLLQSRPITRTKAAV